jgi:hypothetical protein
MFSREDEHGFCPDSPLKSPRRGGWQLPWKASPPLLTLLRNLPRTLLLVALLACLAAPVTLRAQDDVAEPAAEPTEPVRTPQIRDPGVPQPTPEPTPPPTPAPEVTEGQAPPAQEAPQRTRANEAGAPGDLGQFTLNFDRGTRMLRLHVEGQEGPANVQIIVGTEFETQITLDNQDQTPFDAVRIILSYSPDDIEPIAINDSPIAGNMLGDPLAEVDTRFGMILYEAQLNPPVTIVNAPILSVRWKALRVVPSTPIEFSRRQDIFSTIVLGNTDLLGSRRVQGDGTLNLAVSILPEDPREAESMLSDPSLYLRPDEKIGGVQLYLERQPDPVFVGEPFYVDIILDNRAFSMLDGLSVRLSFDPTVLRILDTDRDNWITRETNIHDGPFREMWPWDMHVDNHVQQSRGVISYRKSTTDGEMTRGKHGTIARIWAVPIKPTNGTPLLFQFSDRPRSQGTRVTYVGENTLGFDGDPRSGTMGLMLAINPSQGPRLP